PRPTTSCAGWKRRRRESATSAGVPLADLAAARQSVAARRDRQPRDPGDHFGFVRVCSGYAVRRGICGGVWVPERTAVGVPVYFRRLGFAVPVRLGARPDHGFTAVGCVVV